jgi:hypothetical protein
MTEHETAVLKIRNSSEFQRLKHFVQNVYADGFGNWHAEVLQGEGREAIKARRGAYLAIKLALLEREAIAPNYRFKLAYRADLSTPTLANYSEI